MQKDLPKTQEPLPKPELELTSGRTTHSKSNLQLLVLLITGLFLLGVILCIIVFLSR